MLEFNQTIQLKMLIRIGVFSSLVRWMASDNSIVYIPDLFGFACADENCSRQKTKKIADGSAVSISYSQ